MSEYEIRPYRAGDEEAILATFNHVFALDDPSFVPRTREDWDWAYARNPAGLRVWIATKGDVVAAHYASQPYAVEVDGERRTFAQIVDSMVHPDHRAGLKRPGLFVEVAQRMLAATCGPEREKDLVTFGWPVPQAWRMGKRFLGYEMVRNQLFVAREPGAGSTRPPAELVRLERFPEASERVWRRCAGEWGASVVRDAAYLNWRFFENPRHDYHVLAVTDGEGEPLAHLVYRTADWPVPRAGLVMDWLVPPDEPEAGELLRAAACALARSEGARVVLAIFPEWAAWFERFQEAGWPVQSGGFVVSGRNNEPVHDMYWLRDRWWYQLAELDVV